MHNQSAVEWLIDEMNNIKGSSTNMNGKVQFLEKELNNLFEQAKIMEENQSNHQNKMKIEKIEVKPAQFVWIDKDTAIKDVRPFIGKWHLEKGLIINKFPTYLTDLSECKLIIAASPELNLDGIPNSL